MKTDWNKIIEKYLNNELSPKERANFEATLKTNKEVQKEFEIHQLTKNVIQRNTLRSQVQQTGKHFHFKRKLIHGGIALFVVGVIAATAYFIITNASSTKKINSIPPKETRFEKMGHSLAFDSLQAQYFNFTGKPDIFLTKSGVLLSITKKSLLLNGKPYTGKAIIQWQEAIRPSDIVEAGLSTMAGKRLLETQGMFSINAFTPDGKKLKLSKEGVYVQVPVDSVKQGMKLFTGVPQSNGDVNWTNPVELNRLPVQKTMATIDLYPPEYEPKLNALKWDTRKKKRDSLYLSFEPHNEYMVSGVKSISNSVSIDKKLYSNMQPYNDSTHQYPKRGRDSTLILSKKDYQFIYPSKVLSIWNSKFNNTILATQDFEDRMPFIYQTCNEKVLDLYADNLNLPLWKIDEKVVKLGYKAFQKFADQRVGKIAIDDAHQKNINTFYHNTVKKLHKMGVQRIRAVLKKERHWDRETQKIRNKNTIQNGMANGKNWNQEFLHNLKSVYKQLGITEGFYIDSSTRVTYKNRNVNICNIDRYVIQNVAHTTTRRVSAHFKNKKTGKTAKLIYHPVTVKVKKFNQFNKLYMYCFPKELNSFVRKDFSKGKLSYSLNADFHYSAAIVGITENGYFYYALDKLTPGNLGAITLKEISKLDFEKRINALNNESGKDKIHLKSELAWIFRERKEYKVQQKRRNNWKFRNKVSPTIYSCGKPKSEVSSSEPDEIKEDLYN